MDNHILVAGSTRFRLPEVEVYYTTPDHPDPFTHKHPRQQTTNHWYFHCSGSGDSYIENSFKGVDITLGCGGLLIRSLLNVATQEYIEGTSKVLDAILAATGLTSVKALAERCQGLVTDTTAPLHIIPTDRWDVPIYAAPRVGLTLKKGALERLAYIMEPYRFCIHPERLTKGKPTLVVAMWLFYGKEIGTPAQRQKYLQQARCVTNPLNEIGSTVESQLALFGWRYGQLLGTTGDG